MLTSMDAYAQYARSRRTRPLGLSNRRLAAMLGDFMYETSSAEDESRRYLEILHDKGKQVLTGRDLDSLERFTSEHNREERRAAGMEEEYVSWGRVDGLSREIIRTVSEAVVRTEPEFTENSAALDRMLPRRMPYASSGIRLRIGLRVMAEGDSTSIAKATRPSPRVRSGAGLK